MANLLMVPRVIPDAATADGGYKAVQGFREGTISTTTFLQRLAAAGFVYGASVGSAATAIGGLTTYAVNRPEIVLRNTLATVMMIPFFCNIELTVSSGTALQWLAETAQNDIGNGTSTAATLGPLNLRTDKSASGISGVVRYKYTADATAMTNPLEIWRFSQELATAAGAFAPGTISWNPEVKPMVSGLGSLVFYDIATTTAMSYYGQIVWAETPLTWWN